MSTYKVSELSDQEEFDITSLIDSMVTSEKILKTKQTMIDFLLAISPFLPEECFRDGKCKVQDILNNGMTVQFEIKKTK